MQNRRRLPLLTALAIVTAALLALPGPSLADEPWSAVSNHGTTADGTPARIVALDPHALERQLATGVVELPLPVGGAQWFSVKSTSVTAEGDTSGNRTWTGHAVGAPATTVQLVWLTTGIGAQVLAPGGTWYVTARPGGGYASYRLDDARQRALVEDIDTASPAKRLASIDASIAAPSTRAVRSTGATQRTLRLALSVTGETTQDLGGFANAKALVIQSVAYLNGILERDLAVRLQLVTGNDQLIYTDPATDPFPNGGSGASADHYLPNQTNIDAVIGNANYDIGHVFGRGGGGYGAIGSVGLTGVKAGGVSLTTVTGSPPAPYSDWLPNVVAHEFGHQLGARHTFAGQYMICGVSAVAASAVEPGTGSTLMSYAANCSQDNYTDAGIADAYLHALSFDDIRAVLDGSAAAAGSNATTGNSVPSVTPTGSSFTIPPRTPFRLQATGNDADGGDALTYTWEQMNAGTLQLLLSEPKTAGAAFRSRPPSASPDRFFPPLPAVLAGTTNAATGSCLALATAALRRACSAEYLPTAARTLAFRTTVRDGRGGVNGADTTLTVAGDATNRFAVTSQSTEVALGTGSTQTVAWTVGGTNAAPYDVATVDILASSDGGTTWTPLATATPNDGTQAVTMPGTASATGAFRLMVRANGNVFYDVNHAPLSLNATPDRVLAVTLDQTTASTDNGGTVQLTATVKPVNATNQTVSWTSSNVGVATVSSSGLVTGTGRGTATITATTADGSFTATSTVSVRQQVTGVTVSSASATVAVGSTRQLIGSVTPANATNSMIAWSSSDPSVATVGSAGLVTAVAPGTATITVTSSDGAFTAVSTITVIPYVAVTGVSISNAPATIVRSATRQLTAVLSPAGATTTGVAWTSSNPSVATVNATTGLVTASASTDGTTTITATTSDGGYVATAVITVVANIPVTGITVSATTINVAVGYTHQLTAAVVPADATNQAVTWNNGGSTKATVSSTGLVTGVATGQAIIAVQSSDGGWSRTVTVNVSAPIGVTGVTVDPATATISAGATQQLTATIAPANATNKLVSWSSSDTAAATVSANGLVTGVAPGTATVTGTTADGSRTATSAVTITAVAVTGVALDTSTATIGIGRTRALTATIAPANATYRGITWSSSAAGVATVDAGGVVTAVAAGSANITATTVDGGRTATTTVTVVPVAVTGITLSVGAVSLPAGETHQLTPTVAPADAANRAVAWSSSAGGVATVGAGGLISAVAPGTATITATTADGGLTATATITVTAVAVIGVSIGSGTSSVAAGQTHQLTATVAPANATNATVAWTSGNTGVATVSASGLITAVAPGTAIITVTTLDGSRSDAIVIAVQPVAVTGVALSTHSAALAVGATQQLVATIAPVGATDQVVTWSSSASGVATVSATGLVTAIAPGTATITVTTRDGGLTDAVVVSVAAVPVTTPQPAPTPAPTPSAPAASTPATSAPAATSPAPAATRVISPTQPATAAAVAAMAGLKVPAGAKVKVSVPASQKRTCAVRGGSVVATGEGSCRVTITVTVSGKSTKKTVTIPAKRR